MTGRHEDILDRKAHTKKISLKKKTLSDTICIHIFTDITLPQVLLAWHGIVSCSFQTNPTQIGSLTS